MKIKKSKKMGTSERINIGFFLTIITGIILVIINHFTFHEQTNYNSCYTINRQENTLIHGVYPGGFSGEEDDFSELDIVSYEKHVNTKVSFVYFSHNWYKSRLFPNEKVDWIYARNSIPYIRFMLRSSNINAGLDEKEYSLKHIIEGHLDEDLKHWFIQAASYNKPMFVEYGIEVNGEWFPWNGTWNGREKGPELFRNVYQKLVKMSRKYGASNILWSFHPDSNEYPDDEWNDLENYYPGDDYIDLFTVSAYGMLTPKDVQIRKFSDKIDAVYYRFNKLSPNKKIIVIEFGTTHYNAVQNQERWAREALSQLFSNRWPNIIGFSWWNEFWYNTTKPNAPGATADSSLSTMRVQDNTKLSAVFREVFLRNRDIIITTLKFDERCN